MNELVENALERVKRNSLIVASEDEIQRLSELTVGSEELRDAIRDMDLLMQHQNPSNPLQLTIGRRAIDALDIHVGHNDKLDPVRVKVEPGEMHALQYKYLIPTDTLSDLGDTHYEVVFGSHRFFDLSRIGRVLRDGGDLSFTSKRDRE